MPGQVRSDALFVGLTRPPMLFGVSYLFAVLNCVICMMLYVLMTEFKYLAAMFPIHFVGYLICSKEPLFIDLFKIKMEKCSHCQNRMVYGANSYDPY